MMSIKSTTGHRILLVVLAAVILLAGTASAGWFDKKPNKTQGLLKNHRFNRFPAASFFRGDLHEGARGVWMLDNRTLQLAKDAVVLGQDGQETKLAAGRSAIVSGTIVGDMIFATGVRMIAPNWGATASTTEGTKQPSDVDPGVGVLEGAPQ